MDFGYITYKLLKDGQEVSLNKVPALAKLKNITFDKSIMWAVPVMLSESVKYKGRGESIFEGKYDSFDSLDEIISQWLEAVRAGRAIKYIPESMIPRDPETGEFLLNSNPFDNKYISPEGNMSENGQDTIEIKQAEIPT